MLLGVTVGAYKQWQLQSSQIFFTSNVQRFMSSVRLSKLCSWQPTAKETNQQYKALAAVSDKPFPAEPQQQETVEGQTEAQRQKYREWGADSAVFRAWAFM